MRVLLIGGTGLISTGIIKHLLARGAEVTMFNRAQRPSRVDPSVTQIVGDRNDFPAFEQRFGNERYDAVIDMICFNPQQAQSAVRAFAGRCAQFVFCSTVCTYGVKVPPGVLIDETFAQEPISEYGRNKLACEKVFLEADRAGGFATTIIRPSHTYGPGNPMVDQLEFNPIAWDRIVNNQPVLIADGGLGLWNSTHRDDVGKCFAYACGSAATYGQSYNATTQRVFTWADYYREAAAALDRTVDLISVPADWLVARDPKRFVGLAEIFRFHGPYTSAKALRDIPQFRCEVNFTDGCRQTFEDQRRRDQWKAGPDAQYDALVADALRGVGGPLPA